MIEIHRSRGKVLHVTMVMRKSSSRRLLQGRLDISCDSLRTGAGPMKPAPGGEFAQIIVARSKLPNNAQFRLWWWSRQCWDSHDL